MTEPDTPNQDGSDISARTIAISTAGGIALGTPIWLALDNLGVGIGIAIGIALAVAIGASMTEARKKRDEPGDE